MIQRVESPANLAANLVALAIMQGVNYVAPLATVPYLVRVLGPAGFGLLSFAQGVVLHFALLTDYGFNISSTRAVASHRGCAAEISKIFWCTLLAKLLLMLFSGLALIVLVLSITKLRQTPEIYGVSFLFVIGTAVFPVWLFQGLGQVRLSAIAFGAARLLSIPALLIFVKRPDDYVIAGGIQAGVQLLATAIAAPMICKHTEVRWYRPSLSDFREVFKGGWQLFLSGSALYFASSNTAVVLGFVATPIEVGYYSAAEKLIRAAIAGVSPLNEALFPHIAAKKSMCTRSALRMIRTSFISVSLLSSGMALAIFLGSEPLCRLILGPSFVFSIHILRCLSPLPIFFGLLGVLGTQTMVVFGMDSVISRIMLSGAGLSLVLTTALSVLYGATGAAVASVTVSGFLVGALVVALRYRGLQVWKRLPPAPEVATN